MKAAPPRRLLHSGIDTNEGTPPTLPGGWEEPPKRGTFTQHFHNDKQAIKLFNMCKEHQKNGTVSHTFGALDPVQIEQMSKYLTSVYVSGWQSAETALTGIRR